MFKNKLDALKFYIVKDCNLQMIFAIFDGNCQSIKFQLSISFSISFFKTAKAHVQIESFGPGPNSDKPHYRTL